MPPFVRMLRGYSSWCHSTSAWLMTCTANGVQGQGPGGISVPQGGGRGHHCPGGLCPIQWAGQVGHSAGRSGAPFSGPVRCPIQRAGQVGHSVGRSGGPAATGHGMAWHGAPVNQCGQTARTAKLRGGWPPQSLSFSMARYSPLGDCDWPPVWQQHAEGRASINRPPTQLPGMY